MILEENEKYMKSASEQAKIRILKEAKRTWINRQVKKWSIRILLVSFGLLLIFKPVETGKVIGTWISNFFGTIVKESIK